MRRNDYTHEEWQALRVLVSEAQRQKWLSQKRDHRCQWCLEVLPEDSPPYKKHCSDQHADLARQEREMYA